MMPIVILICHLNVCDRIAQRVPNCENSGVVGQVILAQTGLYHEGDKLPITCVKDG